ncbi:helix-turn-helix domain-containing protein [Roseospira visakhapatnamensis]|uniref:helix-turn-helix domain-containing protein n=1 Tax=Roseospira visakhapatnamensis TaxID=390880 RepID=UPI0016211811
MGTAIKVTWADHDAVSLRRLAGTCGEAEATRRLLAMAMVLEGTNRRDAARQAGMDRQTLCDWVHRSNAAGRDAFSNRKPPGQAPCGSPWPRAGTGDPDGHRSCRRETAEGPRPGW